MIFIMQSSSTALFGVDAKNGVGRYLILSNAVFGVGFKGRLGFLGCTQIKVLNRKKKSFVNYIHIALKNAYIILNAF